MKEIIVIQAGQCGNQIGHRFWEMALNEFNLCHPPPSNDTLSSFFRIVDKRGVTIKPGAPLHDAKLKCRTLLVDTEEGVLNRLFKSSLQGFFDHSLEVKSNSGAGNNWAVGYLEYGDEKLDELNDKIRHIVEECSSPQAFFLMHSLSGGTGSGLGSRIADELSSQYDDITSFTCSLLPSFPTLPSSPDSFSSFSSFSSSPSSLLPSSSSSLVPPSTTAASFTDDVTVSPYNAVLSLSVLLSSVDAVLPMQNSSLAALSERMMQETKRGKAPLVDAKEKAPYAGMNDIAARLLIDLTSSMRFGGSLNLDLNEITTNFIPFASTKLLSSSLSPFVKDSSALAVTRPSLLFDDVFAKESQLMNVDPIRHRYLNCGLFMRSSTTDISEMHSILTKHWKSRVVLPVWNTSAFKLGICRFPPPSVHHSLLCLANNTCVRHPLSSLLARFNILMRRRAFLHCFLDAGLELDEMKEAGESIASVISSYEEFEKQIEIPIPMVPTPLF
ncbi:tubulin epsilon [Monocercomonoides exilis]|uniref:tubulin epsilon n=1 Tax=Monocercomonoides exilis TaxID=2049356 RepID=UPI00355A733F|nr:tubulin epsilon [Monocercomonoides exilis]|eukprot:MONOS_11503.1-p1 / transcript=MONOS_11503.1 / gene=MONOS_11503 / organism=Monocercomonoides_exilis_PA203 / gene_product=tubulin epsilon / transcript_product=tubulin epsilon / location=Mono_scaffold00581:11924-15549(+) / protein_length=498 / sequence_SO=supercontig / SO=protein_coding / is_pseudo=false